MNTKEIHIEIDTIMNLPGALPVLEGETGISPPTNTHSNELVMMKGTKGNRLLGFVDLCC